MKNAAYWLAVLICGALMLAGLVYLLRDAPLIAALALVGLLIAALRAMEDYKKDFPS